MKLNILEAESWLGLSDCSMTCKECRFACESASMREDFLGRDCVWMFACIYICARPFFSCMGVLSSSYPLMAL